MIRTAFSVAIWLTVLASAATSAQQIPLEAWSHDPYITNVALSPSGKKLMAITLPGVNQPPVVTIWNTENFNNKPVRLKPKSSKVIGAGWLNDDKILIVGRQKFDIRAGGKPTRTFRSPVYIANSDGSGKVKQFLKNRKNMLGASIENRLIDQPNKVLLNITLDDQSTEFVELNLKSMVGKRIFRGGDSSSFGTDTRGNVAVKIQLKTNSKGIHQSFQLRNPDTRKWDNHFNLYAEDRVGITPSAIAADGTIYVNDNKTGDKSIIRSYNIRTRALSKPLYSNEKYNIAGLVFDQHSSKGKSDVIGYAVNGPSREIHYTDKSWQALQLRINSALPGTENSIRSYTKSKDLVVIRASSDKEAGAYYLLINGKQILPLGREFPHLKPEFMSDMTFITYKARDGLEIPAFLTTPKTGKKPYPTIILPHGGPWARDYLGWDRWAQFLANRGYAVLQPQYRGSDDWGIKLWRAGDKEWGQKMQDDKDDGAMYLVDQGIADRGRLAMFGYSYGGYAAMAAVVRPNSPYQCAIAGAGVAELDSFDKVTFENPFNRDFQNPTIEGLSPQYVTERANIPLLLFHGDRDTRVPVVQSRKMFASMKSDGKDVQYMEIPDLWHSNPWFPQHHYMMLQKLESYLAKDCGPGGL